MVNEYLFLCEMVIKFNRICVILSKKIIQFKIIMEQAQLTLEN